MQPPVRARKRTCARTRIHMHAALCLRGISGACTSSRGARSDVRAAATQRQRVCPTLNGMCKDSDRGKKKKKKFPNIPLQRAGERGNKQRGGLKKIGTKSRRPRIEKEKWRESISSFKRSFFFFFLKHRRTFPSCVCIQRLRRVVFACFVAAFGPCGNLTWTGTCGLMWLPRQDAERSRRRSPHRVTQGLVNTRAIHINAGGTALRTHPTTPSGLNLCKKKYIF